jgi:hypothetical protein
MPRETLTDLRAQRDDALARAQTAERERDRLKMVLSTVESLLKTALTDDGPQAP